VSLWTRINDRLRLDPPDHRALVRRLRPQRGPLIVGGEEQRLRGIENLLGYGVCGVAGAIILAVAGDAPLAGLSAAFGVVVLAIALRLKRQRPPG
jgi:hypothetical protein